MDSQALNSTTISCAIVLMRNSDVDEEVQLFHHFLGIPIDGKYLARRSNGVLSLHIGTLFSALRSQLSMGNDVAPYPLNAIISGHRNDQNYGVSTTRVAVFSSNESMQNPSSGYRYLGFLSHIPMEPLLPSLDFNRMNLLAMKRDDPKNKDYLETWCPCGLSPEAHFIIIVKPQPPTTPYSVHPHSRDISNSPASRIPYEPGLSRAPSMNNFMPSPLAGSTYGTSDNSELSRAPSVISLVPSPLGITNPALSREPSEMDFPFAAMGSSEEPNALFAENPTPVLETDFSDLERVLKQCGVTDHTIHAAKFQTRSESLLAMVLNHRAMLHVLVKLRFFDPCAKSQSLKSKTITFDGNLQVSTEDVFRCFSWALDSFKHKLTWFSWAEKVANSSEWNYAASGMSKILFLGVSYYKLTI
jgi:hypothetical protein